MTRHKASKRKIENTSTIREEVLMERQVKEWVKVSERIELWLKVKVLAHKAHRRPGNGQHVH